MRIRRRELMLGAAGLTIARSTAAAETGEPLVVADESPAVAGPTGGRAAYELAIAQGADYLAGTLSPSSDGTLMVLADDELGAATDVADRPEFADRRKDKSAGGGRVSGWFSEDFSTEELKALNLVAPLGAGSRRNAVPGAGQILSLQDLIDIARAGSVRTARVVGIYAILNQPAHFAALGLDLEPRLAQTISANGYDWPAAAMFVSVAEEPSLRRLASLTRARRVLRLVGEEEGAARAMARTVPDLSRLAGAANAVALAWDAVLAEPGNSLAARAHQTGLALHAVAGDLPRGHAGAHYLEGLFVAGADAVVCGSPAEAIKARNAARRRRRGDRSAPAL